MKLFKSVAERYADLTMQRSLISLIKKLIGYLEDEKAATTFLMKVNELDTYQKILDRHEIYYQSAVIDAVKRWNDNNSDEVRFVIFNHKQDAMDYYHDMFRVSIKLILKVSETVIFQHDFDLHIDTDHKEMMEILFKKLYENITMFGMSGLINSYRIDKKFREKSDSYGFYQRYNSMRHYADIHTDPYIRILYPYNLTGTSAHELDYHNYICRQSIEVWRNDRDRYLEYIKHKEYAMHSRINK